MIHQHSNDFYWREYLHHDESFDLRMSNGRRVPQTPNIKVRAWFTHSPQYCKAIWSTAVSQHQFYLDKRNSRVCLSKENPFLHSIDSFSSKINLYKSMISFEN